MDLDLSNFINISVADVPRGVGPFNVNNLALFSDEAPAVPPETGYGLYLSAADVVNDYGSGSKTAAMANAIFSQAPNLLAGGGYLAIIPLATAGAELLATAIARTAGIVPYFGVICSRVLADAELTAASNAVQAMNKVLFVASATAADTAVTTGRLWALTNSGNSRTRGLQYLDGSFDDANLMAAAYASRALSVDFSGSRTVQTMHSKSLNTISGDGSMTQALLQQAVAAGVDTYPSFGGVPKTFTSGINSFFDQVYNRSWFQGELLVAAFNALAQVSTKVPQTEEGVSVLKTAHRGVCEQAISNGYAAPGSWTSPDTFGNQADFIRNVQERGYYIYSPPVTLQAQADRAARTTPLERIALKEAGAVHKGNILINVNA